MGLTTHKSDSHKSERCSPYCFSLTYNCTFAEEFLKFKITNLWRELRKIVVATDLGQFNPGAAPILKRCLR